MKFKIKKPLSTDAGSYGGMQDVVWGSIVEAVYQSDKKTCILVSGKEMINIGGLPESFNVNYKYLWGCFEEV